MGLSTDKITEILYLADEFGIQFKTSVLIKDRQFS